MEVVIVCIVLGYVFGCIVGFIGGRFVQKKKEPVKKSEVFFEGSMTLKEIFNQHNITAGDKVYVAIEEVCKQYIEQETKLLSKHILELQADKGELTDKVNKAKEIIREYYEMYSKDYDPAEDAELLLTKAEAFLKE